MRMRTYVADEPCWRRYAEALPQVAELERVELTEGRMRWGGLDMHTDSPPPSPG